MVLGHPNITAANTISTEVVATEMATEIATVTRTATPAVVMAHTEELAATAVAPGVTECQTLAPA